MKLSLALLAATNAALASFFPPNLQTPLLAPSSDTPPHSPLFILHRALVDIESITTHEHPVATYLSHYLSTTLNLHTLQIPVDPLHPKRYSILAYRGPHLPKVLLSSHIDTVPPFYPYHYNKTTDTISGRGSVDAKAAVAAQTIALANLLERGAIHEQDAGLLFVVGEEVNGAGMKSSSAYFAQHRITFDAVIFGEPTERKLVCGHKGITSVTLATKGRAAHSGYPWLGVSANSMLVRALAAIDELASHGGLGRSEKYGDTTVNIGTMTGGVAGNVVPEHAEARLTFRIAEGTPQDVKKTARDAADEATQALQDKGGVLEMDVTVDGYGPVEIACDVKGFETLTVNYGTDVPYLDGPHKRYLYGPGSIFVAHSDHEALKAKDLEASVADYESLVLAALGK